MMMPLETFICRIVGFVVAFAGAVGLVCFWPSSRNTKLKGDEPKF